MPTGRPSRAAARATGVGPPDRQPLVTAERPGGRLGKTPDAAVLHDDGAWLQNGLLDLLVRQHDDAVQEHLHDCSKAQALQSRGKLLPRDPVPEPGSASGSSVRRTEALMLHVIWV